MSGIDALKTPILGDFFTPGELMVPARPLGTAWGAPALRHEQLKSATLGAKSRRLIRLQGPAAPAAPAEGKLRFSGQGDGRRPVGGFGVSVPTCTGSTQGWRPRC